MTAARILVVEDNPANLQLMVYLLQAFGYQTISATDGIEGLELATSEAPSLILMDLQMPRLDGYEAARQLKALPSLRGVPIIAVTAFAMVGDRERILMQGFDGYIGKPIAPETFMSQVASYLPDPRSST